MKCDWHQNWQLWESWFPKKVPVCASAWPKIINLYLTCQDTWDTNMHLWLFWRKISGLWETEDGPRSKVECSGSALYWYCSPPTITMYSPTELLSELASPIWGESTRYVVTLAWELQQRSVPSHAPEEGTRVFFFSDDLIVMASTQEWAMFSA